MTTKSLNPTAQGILDKYDELRLRREQLIEQLADLQRERMEIDSQLQACAVAAGLFGVELPDFPTKEITVSRLDVSEREADQIEASSQSTIRAQIENALRAAYPKPLRSRAIREQIGGNIHEKTVGMTLYRLAKDGTVQHDGWDWYYVPEEHRVAKALGK